MKNSTPNRNGIMIAINSSTRAAIDLASIMVGIIVIGIIGGVIAATIFAVIPWAQDNAAKSVVDQVATSESAYRGFTAEDDGTGSYANKETLLTYVNDATPSKAGLIQDDANYQVEQGVDPEGEPCYAVASLSETGRIFVGWDEFSDSVQADNMNAANDIVAEHCEVIFIEFPNTDDPGNNSGAVTANTLRYYNSGAFQAITPSVDDSQLPWTTVHNGSQEYSRSVQDIKVTVDGVDIPLNAASYSNIYWEISYYNGNVQLYVNDAGSLKNDLVAAGSTVQDFLTKGSVTGEFDGIPNNTINLDIDYTTITGTPPSSDWPNNPNAPQPVYQTVSYVNWTQNNNLQQVAESGLYDQTNSFKVSDNGQYMYVQQNWYNYRARSASEDGGKTWHWLYGCYEGAYADNGEHITSSYEHGGSYGGSDETNRAILLNNCGYNTLGMSSVIPSDTFLPDPYYSNQSYTHVGRNVDELLTSQSNIVALLRSVDYSVVDSNGYQTYPTSYSAIISNDNGDTGSIVELPEALSAAFASGKGHVFLEGNILTLFNGDNQTFNLYDISGGGLSLIHSENLQGQVSSYEDYYYDEEYNPIYYTVYNYDEVSFSASENGQNVVLGGGSGNIGISHDGGATFTWSVPSDDQPEFHHIASSAISNDGDRIIAKIYSNSTASINGIMMISNDGGNTWEDAGAPSINKNGVVFRSDADLDVVRYFIPSNQNITPTMVEWVWGDIASYEECIENCGGGGGGVSAS